MNNLYIMLGKAVFIFLILLINLILVFFGIFIYSIIMDLNIIVSSCCRT